MKSRIAIASLLLAVTQGCSTIWASESYRPVADIDATRSGGGVGERDG